MITDNVWIKALDESYLLALKNNIDELVPIYLNKIFIFKKLKIIIKILCLYDNKKNKRIHHWILHIKFWFEMWILFVSFHVFLIVRQELSICLHLFGSEQDICLTYCCSCCVDYLVLMYSDEIQLYHVKKCFSVSITPWHLKDNSSLDVRFAFPWNLTHYYLTLAWV